MYSNQDLVIGCKKCDEKSQKFLYEKYKNKLMGLAIRYSKTREEAEDLFQESFVKIFKNIKKVKNPDYLERWMKHILINTAINNFRRGNKILFESMHDADWENNNYERILGNIDNDHYLAIIQRMPDGYKFVFQLYVIEGYSHKEIAKLLKISENTSKSQLNRAKRFLKVALGNIGVTKFERYG